MRAVFIKGGSQYDATRLFIDEMAAAFRRRGHETTVIDGVVDADLRDVFAAAAAQGQTDLVYTISLFGDFRDECGRSVAQIFNAPHVLQYVDYPLTHLNTLTDTAPETALLTVDPTHIDAVRSTFGEDHVAHLAFCPHAGVGEPVELDADPDAFAARRPLPILFPASFYKLGAPTWAAEGPDITRIFDSALEIALGAEFIPALDAVDQVLRGMGQDPADPRYEMLRRYSFMVHEHVRKVRRMQLLEAAGKAGLPVFCAGFGYDAWIEKYPSLRLAPAMSLTDVAEFMGRSRVVLNANANFGFGSHERPLTAMLAGAAVASDHSAWWAEQFVEDEDLLLYRWRDLDAGVARIAALAEDPEAAWRMGRNAQAKAAAGHRFDNRVDTVINAAAAVQARQLCDRLMRPSHMTAVSH
ncbi:MAG: glycosyltransferase family 1 protein [Caulobacter sp.]|nr:glycosyltransferase family 1 protein [Caulobacter sp.]